MILVFLFFATPEVRSASGAIHALVIGIDSYESQGGELGDLEGAVNDAKDIAAALREMGAGVVQVLLDDSAHRDAIFEAWENLKSGANPGDTLVLTFAGHGSQEPERVPGSERDGLDEVAVLGGFRTAAPYNYQRVVDDEWRELVAAAKDYEVLLVFDACHSGSMNRSLARGRSRFGQYGVIREDQLPTPPARAVREPTGTLPNEVYVGATKDDLLVQEILIDGEPRGALSYLFARALRGAADLDGDSLITRGELRRFIDEGVRQLTERRQFPVVLYQGDDDVPLLRVGACPERAEAALRPELVLAVSGEARPDVAADALFGSLAEVRRAGPSEAELVWDPARAQVVSPHGDAVAYVSTDDPDWTYQLQGVVDKWRVLPALHALGECREPLRLRIREGDGLHREGATVTVAIEPRNELYLTLVNLPATGEIQFLYPLGRLGDPPRIEPDHPYEMRFVVQAPFGGDHLIAITSTERPDDLHQRLSALHGRRASLDLFEALQATLADPGNHHELGILAFYTSP